VLTLAAFVREVSEEVWLGIWIGLLDVLGVLLVCVLLYGVALIVRRRVLSRHGGTFELSYRVRTEKPGRGWLLGVGRYSGDTLEWFRIFSLSPRPKQVWQREEMSFSGKRTPSGREGTSLYAEHVVVACSTTAGNVELAMSPSSLTGFQSWLEAGPPGTNWDLKPVR
jgi:Protein of unknown function (DUF2550)